MLGILMYLIIASIIISSIVCYVVVNGAKVRPITNLIVDWTYYLYIVKERWRHSKCSFHKKVKYSYPIYKDNYKRRSDGETQFLTEKLESLSQAQKKIVKDVQLLDNQILDLRKSLEIAGKRSSMTMNK
ncbi:hypothetical protein BDB01DRAFT_869076 [Pilobolus umbonatus]|nr:hypothetical protein BDB01DRAFT_869076 [Pilobolus umbonatus]